MKLSAEKRRQTKRKHQIQDHLMQRRNLFANQDMKQLVQNQKLQEVKEDINIDIGYEDPRDIKGLDLSKHLKRKKKSRKRCWICRSLPILKTDVLTSDASGVISWLHQSQLPYEDDRIHLSQGEGGLC